MADAPASPEPSPTPAQPEAPPAPARRRARRGLGALALLLVVLLGLAAVAGAGWRYAYLPLRAQLDASQSALARLRSDVAALTQRQGELSGHLGDQQALLAAQQEALARVQERTAGRESAWRAAEAEHLLRLAAIGARLRDDPALADAALAAADRALAAGAEPAWVPVREAIAQARAALAAVQKVDVVGLRLELRALADALARAPLRGEPRTAGERSADPEQGWWARLQALARELFVVRRIDDSGAVGAAGAAFVRAEVRARFALAELALYRRDGAAFRDQLAALRELVRTHYDPQAAPVAAALDALARYGALDIAPELPDLGAPLERLEAALAARRAEEKP